MQRDQRPVVRHARHRVRRPGAPLGLALGMLLTLLTLLPLGPVGRLIPTASAHAILVRSDPAADAIEQTPPASVRMWFSEDLNAATSRAVVVDPANHEVDNQDSHVAPDDQRQMIVTLPLLRAGTYVVTWRTQSADDGHITAGSFIFRVARPDGTVPPLPTNLPTGNIPGGGGIGASGNAGLDGPTVLQTAATWLALLFMTFWVGGVIWETWVLSPAQEGDPDLAAAARVAARRFRRLAPWALGLVLIADVLVVLAQSTQLAGDWSGLFSAPLLGAILFRSRFGTFWWARQIIAGAALALAALEARRTTADARASNARASNARASNARASNAASARPHPSVTEPRRLREWGPWMLRALRAAPGAFARGWRTRSPLARVSLALALALLAAFALSGHAAAVPQRELAYALAIDLLHLLGNAAWLGGLLYIAVVLVPALQRLPDAQRARVLVRGLPHFSALAIVTVIVLGLTGSLNATVHLTAASQLLTTTYGRTLAVKTELFLIMAGISAYHAFRLRPRLEAALAEEQVSASGRHVADAITAAARTTNPLATGQPRWAVAARAGARGHATDGPTQQTPRAEQGGASTPPLDGAPPPAPAEGRIGGEAVRLAAALEDWLRREAALGVGILLCVALLAAFAGSLVPAAPAGARSAAPTGAGFAGTQTAAGLSVTLKVAPAAFGSNTFTVILRDATGKPVDGAGVAIATEILDMDMGVQTAQLQPTGDPGVYSVRADLAMAGNWAITVRVLPANSPQFQTFTFHLVASY